MMSPVPDIENKPAPGISYFTPYQETPAGQAANPQSDGSSPPKLFQPLDVRGLTLHNRIGVSNKQKALRISDKPKNERKKKECRPDANCANSCRLCASTARKMDT